MAYRSGIFVIALRHISTLVAVALSAAAVSFGVFSSSYDLYPAMAYASVVAFIVPSVYFFLGMSRMTLLSNIATYFRVVFNSFKRDLDEAGYDRTSAGAQLRVVAV